jgi:hypothetical protein
MHIIKKIKMFVRLIFIFSAKILNITRNDFDFVNCRFPVTLWNAGEMDTWLLIYITIYLSNVRVLTAKINMAISNYYFEKEITANNSAYRRRMFMLLLLIKLNVIL